MATEEKWSQFEENWRKTLSDFGVSYFHASEFNGHTGPFESWKDAPDKKAEFLHQLIKVLKRGVNKSFSTTVKQEDFDAVDIQYKLKENCSPYLFGGGACVRKVHTWIMKDRPDKNPLHTIEKGDLGQHKLCRVLDTEGLAYAVVPKKDPVTGEWLAEFQGADLLAWEYRRGFSDVILKAKYGQGIRKSFREIYKHIPHEPYHLERADLIAMCERYPTEFPTRT